jgi:hypothetical protein
MKPRSTFVATSFTTIFSAHVEPAPALNHLAFDRRRQNSHPDPLRGGARDDGGELVPDTGFEEERAPDLRTCRSTLSASS